MVEKPKAEVAPSNYSISGRYILQPEIFGLLEKQGAGAGGEIQLTDSMLRLAETQDFFGYRFDGRIFDTGSKIGFLTANLAYGLEREDLAADLMAEVRAISAR
jgi:UTP--glucose-1-phosphate uridylyltransferase